MTPVLRRTLLTACIVTVPCAAIAQTWQDALKKGNYEAAVALLQPLAVESLVNPDATDPEPPHQLAIMYEQGLGVARDLVMACTLAQMSARVLQPGAIQTIDDMHAYEARTKAADDFVHHQCDSLSDSERNASNRSGCLWFGMPQETLELGSQAIRVDYEGIRLASDNEHRYEIPVNCPVAIARVRALTMEPPGDAVPGLKPRHFIDVLGWQVGGNDPRARRYALQWQLYELRGKKLELVMLDDLDVRDTWPVPMLPEDFDKRLTIEMIRTGHVHWKIDGAPPKRGWVMLPEASK
jgi:hypothetical protein